MSRRCDSSKPTPTPLTVWLWSQEHAKKSSRKKRRPYNKAIVTHQKLPHAAGVAGGAEKALEPAACRRCGGGGRKGSTANQPQKRYYGEASPRRYGGNTGASTREKSCEQPPAGHRQGGGLDEETTSQFASTFPCSCALGSCKLVTFFLSCRRRHMSN